MSLTFPAAYDLAVELSCAVVEEQEGQWPGLTIVLQELSGRDWLMLDAAARTYRHQQSTPVAGVRGWLGTNLDEPTGFVAAVTSLHADGRFRERAASVLAQKAGPVALAAVAVRLLDHVPQVRIAAENSLVPVLVPDLGERALDVVLSGRDRVHGPRALEIVETRLRALLGDATYATRLMGASARRVRRRGFEVAHADGLLTPARLREVARTDTDQLILSWCSDWLLESGRPSDFADLLNVRSVLVRQVAVLRADDSDLPERALLSLTADRAPRVRDAARLRARRRGLDVAAWYRAQLGPDLPPGATCAILDGLLTVGGAGDLPLFTAALVDRRPRVRAAAVRGVATWATWEHALQVLPELLLDPSPRVSSAAARVLARIGVPTAVTERAWASAQPGSRRAAWHVARASGGWDRVEADLRLAVDSDPELAGLGSVQLLHWLHLGAASTWQHLGTDQRDRIATALEQWGASQHEKRLVAFHAGIRLVSADETNPVHEPTPSKSRWWRRARADP